MAEKSNKMPTKCKKILQELEKRAPQSIHYKELAFLCNMTTFELSHYINSYQSYFTNVERIEGKNYIKYRLNLSLQHEKYEENTPDLTIRDKIHLFFEKRKD